MSTYGRGEIGVFFEIQLIQRGLSLTGLERRDTNGNKAEVNIVGVANHYTVQIEVCSALSPSYMEHVPVENRARNFQAKSLVKSVSTYPLWPPWFNMDHT